MQSDNVPLGFKRVFQLMQLIHAQIIAEQQTIKAYPSVYHRAMNVKRQIQPIMNDLNKSLPEHVIEGLLDEQNDTYKLLVGILDMHPDQRREVFLACRNAGVIK